MHWGRTISSLILVGAACGAMAGQAVVSARAGVINFLDGSAFLNDQPLQPQAGTFSSVKNGEVLRTEKGRAEVLLTPGVILRIDENSAFRMVSDSLTDTRVEFLRGAAILDSNDAAGKNPVTLTYKTYSIRFEKPGVYRVDSEPGILETYTGQAEITAEGEAPKPIDESHEFFFGIGMETNKYGEGAVDAFSEWARNRAETIEADNRAAEQSTQAPPDPGNLTPFGIPVPMPNMPATAPSYGTLSAPVFIDNGFYGGAYNSPFGLGFGSPVAIFYVVPRNWWRHPGGGIPTPHPPRYPSPLPRTGYPHISGWHPSQMPVGGPVRNSFARPATSYVHPAVRPMAAPRMAAPPTMRAPVTIHR